MCINIEIVLPTLETFLLLYTLRQGSIVILIWTIFRACFCVLFFTMAILEVLVHESPPFGAWLVNADYKVPKQTTLIFILFYSYEILLICEFLLLVFTSFLGYGIYFEKSNLLKYYLICRFITWCAEVLLLTLLCLSHILLIGYYLCILLFIVLEFYSLVVVYSYYVSVSELEQECRCKGFRASNGEDPKEKYSFCSNN